MDTLAFESGRDPEIIPSWKLDINSNIISCSATLGARASALRCLEGIYEVDGHGKIHVQKHIGPVVDRTLELLRQNIENELEELRKDMEKECRSVFSEQRISLDQENFAVCTSVFTYYRQPLLTSQAVHNEKQEENANRGGSGGHNGPGRPGC
jgi:hypothetical protein